MTKFLTVKEAAKITGKSPSSVRRIIYPILEDNQHPDRHHIEPDVETAQALRLKGENFAWKISEELLARVAADGGVKSKPESKSDATGDGQSAVIIQILRSQLEIKDQQLATANDVIKGLSERVREGNILMGSLQQQLAAPNSVNRDKSHIVDADRSAPKPEQGSEASPTETKKVPWWQIKIF